MNELTEEQTQQLLEDTKDCIGMGQRAGQALFNCLEIIAPQIAARIRQTNCDPFYNSGNITACLKSILPNELQGKYIHLFTQLNE